MDRRIPHHVRMFLHSKIDMRRFALSLVLLLGAMIAVSASNPQGKGLTPLNGDMAAKARQEISASTSLIQSLVSRFTQTKTLSILNDKMVSEGKMYFNEGMLRWEYTAPYKYLFIMNREKVLLQGGGSTSKMNMAENRMFSGIASIMMKTVTGQGLDSSDDYTVSYFTDKDGLYVVKMTPLKREMKQMFSGVVLHFNADANVTSVELLESGDDNTVITLHDTKTNIPIDEKIFAID